MKDIYRTEYVRPTACSHFGCPPWRCLLAHPEPILPPAPSAEERLAERERVRGYRELAADYRGYAARATSPQIRDELNRKASDYEQMANGRWEETSAVKASAKSRDEVQQAGSERLFASAFVGVICGLAFLYATWGEFGKEIPVAILSTFLIVGLCTWSINFLLNLILGLPRTPQSESGGGSKAR